MPRNKIEVLTKFHSYHDRLEFTYEVENENSISFLNMSIAAGIKIIKSSRSCIDPQF